MPDTEPQDSPSPHELPDLDAVADKIHEARDAEDTLMHTMPNAIDPDDSGFPGMTPMAADDDKAQENLEEEPETRSGDLDH